MLENHRRAVEDLVWRHLEADARMGIKGQDTDPDRIGGVWDGERDYSTHMRHLGVNARGERTFFREALRRREAIDAALRTLSEDDRAVIRAAFEPFGRVSPGVAEVFSVSCHGSRVCLLGLAINTRAALVGYGKRHNQVSPCGADIVDWIELEGRSIAFMEGEIRRLKGKTSSSHVFEKMKSEALPMLEGALAAYETVRRGNVAAREVALVSEADSAAQEAERALAHLLTGA